MKKTLALLLVLVLALSVSLTAVATSDNSDKKEITGTTDTQDTEDSKGHGNGQSDKQKQFVKELKDEKKALQQQKSTSNQALEKLQTEYDALVAAGDAESAAAILEEIDVLKIEITTLKAQIKNTINERFMVVKTLYTQEELQQFEGAADLIAQMHEDAHILAAGSISVKNNLIKFDAPAYIKGGVTLVPLRAISEELGAEVSWTDETKTVTITKDDIVIEITAGSTVVLINGTPVDITLPAEITSGRTYLPLRFLAETLDFIVIWDGENKIIDIEVEDPADETPAT